MAVEDLRPRREDSRRSLSGRGRLDAKKLKRWIEELELKAFEEGGKVDWETGTIIPNPMKGMNHWQRDTYVNKLRKDEYWQNRRDLEDKDPDDWGED